MVSISIYDNNPDELRAHFVADHETYCLVLGITERLESVRDYTRRFKIGEFRYIQLKEKWFRETIATKDDAREMWDNLVGFGFEEEE